MAKAQTKKIITPVQAIEGEIQALAVHQESQMKALLDKLNKAKEEEEQRNAGALIAQYVQDAENSLAAAEALALKYGLEFEFGPTYGMGGTFNGTDWDASRDENGNRTRTGQWQSSSHNC